MTAPKSGGQLFLKGGTPFIETVIVEEKATLKKLADWLRARGEKHKEAIWFRDADTAEKRGRPRETGKQPTPAPVAIRRGSWAWHAGKVIRV